MISLSQPPFIRALASNPPRPFGPRASPIEIIGREVRWDIEVVPFEDLCRFPSLAEIVDFEPRANSQRHNRFTNFDLGLPRRNASRFHLLQGLAQGLPSRQLAHVDGPKLKGPATTPGPLVTT